MSSKKESKEHDGGYSAKTQMKQAAAGGIAGGITRFVTQPLDVLKIRFQMQVEPVIESKKSKYTGVYQAFKVLYHEEGIRGYWKGHNAGQVMSITYALMQFWSYEQFRLASRRVPMLQERPLWNYFACGGAAGCVGTFFAQPYDVIRTRVIASDRGTKNSQLYILSGVYQIVRQEGFSALFRGLSFALVQVYPLVGFNFLFYKQLNLLAAITIKRLKGSKHIEKQIPTWLLFCTGGIAGVLSKAIVYPLDLLKKRIQLTAFVDDRKTFGKNPKCPSLMKCIMYTYKREGVSGFFKGMIPTLIKSGITSAFYFACYDSIISLIFNRRFLGKPKVVKRDNDCDRNNLYKNKCKTKIIK